MVRFLIWGFLGLQFSQLNACINIQLFRFFWWVGSVACFFSRPSWLACNMPREDTFNVQASARGKWFQYLPVIPCEESGAFFQPLSHLLNSKGLEGWGSHIHPEKVIDDYIDRGFRKWSFHAPLPRLGFLEFFHRFFLPENTCWNKSVFERLLSLAELLPLTDKEEKGPALLAQAEGNRDDRDGDDRRDDSGIINPSSSADNALSRPSLLKRWHWAP